MRRKHFCSYTYIYIFIDTYMHIYECMTKATGMHKALGHRMIKS